MNYTVFVIIFKLITFVVWGGHCDCSARASRNLATPLHACCIMATAKHQTSSCASEHILPLESCECQFPVRYNKKYGTDNAQIWHRDTNEIKRRSTYATQTKADLPQRETKQTVVS
jgi:hypothetical protein